MGKTSEVLGSRIPLSNPSKEKEIWTFDLYIYVSKYMLGSFRVP